MTHEGAGNNGEIARDIVEFPHRVIRDPEDGDVIGVTNIPDAILGRLDPVSPGALRVLTYAPGLFDEFMAGRDEDTVTFETFSHNARKPMLTIRRVGDDISFCIDDVYTSRFVTPEASVAAAEARQKAVAEATEIEAAGDVLVADKIEIRKTDFMFVSNLTTQRLWPLYKRVGFEKEGRRLWVPTPQTLARKAQLEGVKVKLIDTFGPIKPKQFLEAYGEDAFPMSSGTEESYHYTHDGLQEHFELVMSGRGDRQRAIRTGSGQVQKLLGVIARAVIARGWVGTTDQQQLPYNCESWTDWYDDLGGKLQNDMRHREQALYHDHNRFAGEVGAQVVLRQLQKETRDAVGVDSPEGISKMVDSWFANPPIAA